MHRFKDMFTTVKDLRAEVPWIGRWGFVLDMPTWLGGLLFIDRIEHRAFENTCATKAGA